MTGSAERHLEAIEQELHSRCSTGLGARQLPTTYPSPLARPRALAIPPS